MQTEYYKRYIRSPDWQRKKQERYEIDNHKCVMCGRYASNCRYGLQVHHISYRNLGHEDPYTDLVTLCPRCHRWIHNYLQRKTKEE